MYNRKLKTAIVRFFLRAGKRLFGSDLVNRIYLTDLNIGVKKMTLLKNVLAKIIEVCLKRISEMS